MQAGEKSWNGVWIGDCPETERLNRLNRLESALGELRERWDNRLSLGNNSFAEEYKRGRLTLACYFHWTCGADGERYGTFSDYQTNVFERMMVLILGVDNDGLERNDRYDQSVLVEIVEGHDLPNTAVPSWARIYRVGDELCEIGHGLLYYSVMSGLYKSLPIFSGRKCDLAFNRSQQLKRDVIDCASEIVSDIPDQKRDKRWHICEGFEFKGIIPGLQVRIDTNFAEVRLEKGCDFGVEFVDVAFGPFDL